MKRHFTMLLAVALLCAVLLPAAALAEAGYTQLGTSNLYVALPEGYAPASMEYVEYQVGYFYKDDVSVDMDVYQWEKGEKTLEEEVADVAASFDSEAEYCEFNGMPAMLYRSYENFEDYEWVVLNYVFEAENAFVELSFWTDGSQKEFSDVEQIVMSIRAADHGMYQLGTSGLYIQLPEGYMPTSDDLEKDQMAYVFKDDQSMDMDIWQWDKDGKTLVEAATEVAETYDAVPEICEFNGMTAMMYKSVEVWEDLEYQVLNYIFETEEDFVEISFWTDGSQTENVAVEEILLSISMK